MEGLERLIQIGTVTATDPDAHKVRVKFPDTGLTSDWLCVLRNAPTVSISNDGLHSHTGSVRVDTADGHAHGASVSIEQNGEHSHYASIYAWMPKINDTVLVVYLPVFNSDGFVIGGI